MAVLQRLALRGTPKATKAAARYTPAGGAERCGMCRHYVPSSSCARIEGPVSAAGWCQLYSQQVTWRPRAGQDAGFNPGLVPPGATLDLSFLTPGSLDPRITFTRASTGTYFDVSGTMQTTATNLPRWDYNPSTHAVNGLLIEEARTNIYLQSGTLANSPWVPTGATVAAGTLAPDGSTNAIFLKEDAGNTQHNIGQTVVNTTGVAWVFSVFAKAGTRSILNANGLGLGALGLSPQWNLAAGTDITGGSNANFTHGIQAIGNGWYRCWFSYVPTNTTAPLWIMCSTPGSPIYPGDNVSGMYLWGACAELGGFVTSYIPAAASAASRAYDLCIIPPANVGGWFVSPGGSWMAEFVNLAPSIAGRNPRIVAQNAASGVAPLYEPPSGVLSTYDGAGPSTANLISANAITKAASNWTPGTGKVCLNGGAVGSAVMSVGFAALATSGIGLLAGASGNATESLSGYLRRARYWPRALSDAELQTVTT